jgi:hypothetical protein
MDSFESMDGTNILNSGLKTIQAGPYKLGSHKDINKGTNEELIYCKGIQSYGSRFPKFWMRVQMSVWICIVPIITLHVCKFKVPMFQLPIL